MGKLCENQQEIYAAYRVANLLGVYEDCSPNGFYQRWKQKNAFMKAPGGRVWNWKYRSFY